MNAQMIEKFLSDVNAGRPESLFGRTDYVVMTQYEVESFAELIIKECVNRIQGCHLAEGYDPTIVGDFELGYQRAIDKVSRQVLLHFRVE